MKTIIYFAKLSHGVYLNIKRKMHIFLTRKGLKSYDFTIISNNCWGGIIYDKYKLQYLSPTIGCFFMAKDYINFISNLKYYLNQPLKQVPFTKSNFSHQLEWFNEEDRNNFIKKGDSLIIGQLDNVEIIFYHSNSFESTKEKWERRVKRINYDKMLIKFNDQNGCNKNDVIKFEQLPYKNKLFFTSNKEYKQICTSSIYLKRFRRKGFAVCDTDINALPFNEQKYLNNLFFK